MRQQTRDIRYLLRKQEGPVIANIAEDGKCKNYRQLETSHYFEPVAIETFGGIGETTYLFLKYFSRRIDAKTQEKMQFSIFKTMAGHRCAAWQRHLCA